MSRPRILDFLFDGENVEEMWAHGIVPEQALQVLDNRPLLRVNRKDRRGMYLLIGRDNGGRCLAIPIEPTHDAELWRPITAWPCKRHEEARFERR
jgi:hypothetical protein